MPSSCKRMGSAGAGPAASRAFRAAIPPANRRSFLVFLLSACLAVVAVPGVGGFASAGTVGTTGSPEPSFPPLEAIEATAYVVMDRLTGAILLEKNGQASLYPASTTKILTALLALETLDPAQVATASAEAVMLPEGSSSIGLEEGERLPVRDLLYGLMLASGNDAANVLAETAAGGIEAFAKQMEGRARELGALDSSFRNPSGLHHPEHRTTARDLLVLARAAMARQDFRDLVSTPSWALPPTNRHPYLGWGVLTSTNRLMLHQAGAFESERLRSVSGIKTGATPLSGSNLVTSATTADGVELLAAVMGVPKHRSLYIWSYARTLLEAGADRARETATPLAGLGTTSGWPRLGEEAEGGPVRLRPAWIPAGSGPPDQALSVRWMPKEGLDPDRLAEGDPAGEAWLLQGGQDVLRIPLVADRQETGPTGTIGPTGGVSEGAMTPGPTKPPGEGTDPDGQAGGPGPWLPALLAGGLLGFGGGVYAASRKRKRRPGTPAGVRRPPVRRIR